jgi:hypothetical protein
VAFDASQEVVDRMSSATIDELMQPEAPHRARLQDRVPLDDITAEARKASPGRAIAAVIGGFLFAIGWLLAKSFRVVWFSGAWMFSAAKIGWRQAQGLPLSQPSVDQLMAENQRLRAEISRIQI